MNEEQLEEIRQVHIAGMERIVNTYVQGILDNSDTMAKLHQAQSEFHQKNKHLLPKEPKYKVLFTIHCVPSNTNKYPERDIGYYSSQQIAEKYFPKDGTSYDSLGRCTWTYSIKEIPQERITRYMISFLNKKPPLYFPF